MFWPQFNVQLWTCDGFTGLSHSRYDWKFKAAWRSFGFRIPQNETITKRWSRGRRRMSSMTEGVRGGGNTSFLLISISMKSFRQNNSRWFFFDTTNNSSAPRINNTASILSLESWDGLVQYQFVAQWNVGDWPVIVCHLSTSSSGDHHRKVVLYNFIFMR